MEEKLPHSLLLLLLILQHLLLSLVCLRPRQIISHYWERAREREHGPGDRRVGPDRWMDAAEVRSDAGQQGGETSDG